MVRLDLGHHEIEQMRQALPRLFPFGDGRLPRLDLGWPSAVARRSGCLTNCLTTTVDDDAAVGPEPNRMPGATTEPQADHGPSWVRDEVVSRPMVAAPAARRLRAINWAPGVQVLGDVADDGGLAGGAGGGVDAGDAFAGYGEHAERVMAAQVFFGGELQLRELVEAGDVVRLQT
jgi:hypothetical protein